MECWSSEQGAGGQAAELMRRSETAATTQHLYLRSQNGESANPRPVETLNYTENASAMRAACSRLCRASAPTAGLALASRPA